MNLWSGYTAKELEEKIKQGHSTAILPFGSVEQHGNHLATGYDILIAERIARDLALKINALILPNFSIGEASHHIGFPGTLSFSNDTLQRMLSDLCDSLTSCGITKLVIINGHGGNYSVIRTFVENYQKPNFNIIHDGFEEILFKVIKNLSNKFSNADLGLHAGFFETSMALYTHPEAVKIDELKIGSMPTEGNEWSKSQISSIISEGLLKSTPSGVIGDPRLSNAKDGEVFFNMILREYLKLVEGPL